MTVEGSSNRVLSREVVRHLQASTSSQFGSISRNTGRSLNSRCDLAVMGVELAPEAATVQLRSTQEIAVEEQTAKHDCGAYSSSSL